MPTSKSSGKSSGRWLGIFAGGCALLAACSAANAAAEPPHSAELDAMIVKAAQRHGVPETLVRRIVMRESRYNPLARNHKYWGLMQISYPTAKSMGFKGTPQELLNPLVNLTYAVPYLANAFIIAGKREDQAVRLYASGYYEAARHRGLLGALRTADSVPATGVAATPAAEPPPSPGFFGSLFGAPEPQQPTFVAAAATEPAEPAAPATVAAVSPVAGGLANTRGVATLEASAAASAMPKKWLRDGGVTVLARGEQGLEKIAASAQGSAPRRTARHSRKVTSFASLDTPATAQAYASSPAEAATASQAAITQAISPAPGTGEAGVPQADNQAAAPTSPAASRAATASKKRRKVAAKVAAKEKQGTAKEPSDEPAAADGLRP